jgi:YceI-like domain
MSPPAGTHTLGPEVASLTVRTGKSGAIALAGHNLLIEVGSWNATLVIGQPSSLSLDADPRSLRVLEGTGGVQPLGDEDKQGIAQTIDEEVLKGGPISFRSSSVRIDGDQLEVEGSLELLGTSRTIAFSLAMTADGGIRGEVSFKQSHWGIKPYSALFGTLKVSDELTVAVDGTLSP